MLLKKRDVNAEIASFAEFDRPLGVGIQERKQGPRRALRQDSRISRNGRLITIGVTPKFIDRAEGGRRDPIPQIHEGARSKIVEWSLPESAVLSVFITPWMKLRQASSEQR